ncbi:MAG: LamG-like jellyroll fold domain-containing protein [Verrucomicrobiaceae bacterium]
MKSRIDQLADLTRRDALTADDQQELNALLKRDPEARQRFVGHLLLEHDLRELNELPHDKPANITRFLIPALIGLAAAITLLASFFWKADVTPPAITDTPGEEPFLTSVAVVRRVSDLGDQSTTLRSGQVIQPGTIEVSSGLLQLDLHNGVSLVVEAPAQFDIISSDLIHLAHGKIRAQVPPPAQGFRIETTSFDIVDLGTEFAISLDSNGKGELHVIDGEVELYQKTSPNKAAQLLTAGHGVGLDHTGKQTKIQVNPANFADSKTLLEGSQRQRLRWQTHFTALAKDPDTVALYDFQPLNGALPNLATNAAPDSQGIIIGCSSVQGRWPDKTALSFSNPSHRVRTKIPGTFDTLTFATWIKVESLSHVSIPLIQSQRTDGRSLTWDLRKKGQLTQALAFFSDVVGGAGHQDQTYKYLSANPALSDSQFGTWIHLAVTIDNHNKQLVHYVNGQILQTLPINTPHPLVIGIADLGNWPSRDWAKGTKWEIRHLIGSMGEFLISQRVFSPRDIRRLHAAGSPE